MWVDRVVELIPRQRLVAIKHVSLAEEHLHDHFEASSVRAALPVMPASLIIEGMAQTAGILVGHAEDFREKVILAKVSRAELSRDAVAGETLRYTADIRNISDIGAATHGKVELITPSTNGGSEPEVIGRIDLMFSHVDQNLSGMEFPKHNFVFGEQFKTLLRMSGVEIPVATD